MRNKNLISCRSRSKSGVVLLITLVLLVVLATLGYTLSSRVAAQRHRDLYIIDYAKARYACDSAVKYALATLQEINPQIISRPNEPDFSDLFVLSQAQYQQLLAQCTAENTSQTKANFDFRLTSDKADRITGDINNSDKIGDINNISDINDINDVYADPNKPGSITIRGPYGPPWPFVTKPVEFEVGSAKVRIEIEDENAKYPVGWLILDDQKTHREIEAGFEVFCQWMGLEKEQVDSIKDQVNQISQIKTFQLEFKPIKQTVQTAARTSTAAVNKKTSTKTTRTPSRPRTTTKTVSASEQLVKQNADFAQLFHSTLFDKESLARPYIQGRDESALKYMGMWASNKVNINTAPRHVLEAAFAFGGLSEAPQIANEIIQLRRDRSFTDIEDLKKTLSRYSDPINKSEKYITTVSSYFTIKVTAISGVARASTIIAITKDGDQVEQTAVISD